MHVVYMCIGLKRNYMYMDSLIMFPFCFKIHVLLVCTVVNKDHLICSVVVRSHSQQPQDESNCWVPSLLTPMDKLISLQLYCSGSNISHLPTSHTQSETFTLLIYTMVLVSHIPYLLKSCSGL